MGIGDTLQEGLTNVTNLIGENPLASAATAAGLGAVVGVGTGALATASLSKKSKKSSSRSRRKRVSRIKHTKRGLIQDRKRRSKQKWEVAYQKRKKKKHSSKSGKKRGKRIYFAKKTGQPYILKANGQARFIKGKRRKK